MMKKYLAILLAAMLVLSFGACAKKTENETTTAPQQTDSSAASQTEATVSSDNETTVSTTAAAPTEKKEDNVLIETEAEYIVFNVSKDFTLEQDAWLGVIPTGTIYENEIDADDVDIIYAYCDNLDDENSSSYRFAFDKENFNSIEDGIFDLVLCSSDNGETGKVLLQTGLEKTGENIAIDYKNDR